jgi:capsular polysaccharide transport system permease protein
MAPAVAPAGTGAASGAKAAPAPAAGGPAPRPAPPRPASAAPPGAAAPRPAARVAPPVRPARIKRRHRAVGATFVLAVVVPALVSAWYLWGIADDQYASTVAFSVRKEEVGSAIELLGGITELSGSSSSDTDILYEFIQSQKLVSEIDTEIDLRAMWSKPDYDPAFAYDPAGTIEDLVDQWERMVRIYYDSATGLIEVRTLAFAPQDATAIATVLYQRSTAMINALNAVAREDSIRYARDELDTAVERLKAARSAITAFRNRTQIVDPSVDLQSQAGLLGNLEAQLAAALIEVDVLKETTRDSDPRMEQATRRVRVIENRIQSERQKMGIGTGVEQGQVFADLVGEYERLQVDLQFAEQSYTAALATYDGAQAEARRQSRYLAAHILPTDAEKSQYPQRWTILGVITLFAFLLWAISVLVAFSLKDRS